MSQCIVSMKLELAAKAVDVLVGDMAVAPKEDKVKSCQQLRALVFMPQTGCDGLREAHPRRLSQLVPGQRPPAVRGE